MPDVNSIELACLWSSKGLKQRTEIECDSQTKGIIGYGGAHDLYRALTSCSQLGLELPADILGPLLAPPACHVTDFKRESFPQIAESPLKRRKSHLLLNDISGALSALGHFRLAPSHQ